MNAITYFGLNVLSILALVALSQIQLVDDLITHSGYSLSEVFAGVAAILVIIYTVMFTLTFKR